MTSHAATIREANEQLIENGATDRIAEYFSEAYVVHAGGLKRSGHKWVRDYTVALHKAFSNLSVEVDILLESDDRIAWRRKIQGKQTGPFQGFPASGRKIAWHDLVVTQFDEGLIAEDWVVTDLAEQLLRSRKRSVK